MLKLFSIFVFAATLAASSSGQYMLRDLGQNLPGNSWAYGVNGPYVVGVWENPNNIDGYLYDGNSFQVLSKLSGYNVVYASGVNGSGWVAGANRVNYGESTATVWTNPGNPIDIGSTLPAGSSFASGINSSGKAVGYVTLQNSSGRAFVWSQTQGLSLLPNGGNFSTSAYAINEDGVIAGSLSLTGWGSRVAIWDLEQNLVDLGTLGGNTGFAYDINSNGSVVGASDLPSAVYHAFLWTTQGGMYDLGTLGGPASQANGVNDSGVIVGWSHTTSQGDPKPFIWSASTGMIELPGFSGSSPGQAWGVDSHGVISGSLWRSDLSEWHAVTWTPVPEPATIGILGLGLALLAKRRKK